jgi:hypothetical protein
LFQGEAAGLSLKNTTSGLYSNSSTTKDRFRFVTKLEEGVKLKAAAKTHLSSVPAAPLRLMSRADSRPSESRSRKQNSGAVTKTREVRLLEGIRGGQRDRSRRRSDGSRMPKSRAIKGIDEDMKFNQALWEMAEVLRNRAAQ